MAGLPVGPWILGIGYWVLEKKVHSRCFWLTNFLTTDFIAETFSAIKRVVKNFSPGYWKITVNCSIPNTQYPIHNTKHSILFCLTGYWKHGKLFTQYPIPITQYPTLKTFLPDWVLKNQSCFIVSFFWSKLVVFYCIFFRVKNVSHTGLSVAPKFLGIGYWVLVRWVLRRFLVGNKLEVITKISVFT